MGLYPPIAAAVIASAWLFAGLCFGTGVSRDQEPLPDTTCLIISDLSGEAMEVQNASRRNLTPITVSVVHGGAHQCWRFRREIVAGGEPAYVISSLKSGKVLDVAGYSKADDAPVQQFTYYGSNNQRWRFSPDGRDRFHIVSVNSEKCLELKTDSRVRQTSCRKESASQRWRITASPASDTAFAIIARHSGKALDIEKESLFNKAIVQQFTPHFKDNQLWTLYPGMPQQTVAIISFHSGKALDVAGFSTRDTAAIQQFDYHGGANQLWRLTPADPPYYRIMSVHSGKCLDVKNASEDDGEDVRQFPCGEGAHQLWRLIPKSLVPSSGDSP